MTGQSAWRWPWAAVLSSCSHGNSLSLGFRGEEEIGSCLGTAALLQKSLNVWQWVFLSDPEEQFQTVISFGFRVMLLICNSRSLDWCSHCRLLDCIFDLVYAIYLSQTSLKRMLRMLENAVSEFKGYLLLIFFFHRVSIKVKNYLPVKTDHWNSCFMCIKGIGL